MAGIELRAANPIIWFLREFKKPQTQQLPPRRAHEPHAVGRRSDPLRRSRLSVAAVCVESGPPRKTSATCCFSLPGLPGPTRSAAVHCRLRLKASVGSWYRLHRSAQKSGKRFV